MEKKLNVNLFWSNVSLTASVLDAQQFSFAVAPGSVNFVSLESGHRKKFAFKAGGGAWLALRRRPCAELSRNRAICHLQPCSDSGELANMHASEGGTGPFCFITTIAFYMLLKIFLPRGAFWDMRCSICCHLSGKICKVQIHGRSRWQRCAGR